MKFTQEDLLNAMGLKVGEVVELSNGNRAVIQRNRLRDLALVEDNGWSTALEGLIGVEYTVIPQPKYTLTETEKHIVLAIDEKHKWIARSSYGNLFVYASKPIKEDDAWFRCSLDYCEFHPFNHLFQFIQWSDPEPVSLDELREIAKK